MPSSPELKEKRAKRRKRNFMVRELRESKKFHQRVIKPKNNEIKKLDISVYRQLNDEDLEDLE